jgi:ABC-type multidrug transport system permease subunit
VKIGHPRARRTSKGWTLTFLAAILLCAVGPVGFAVMLRLQDAADRKTQAACKVAPLTAHYRKGFSFALPVGVLAVVLLGLVLAFVVFVFGGQTPGWMKAVGACVVLVAVLSALFVGMIASEYHDYPGSDITTAMGEPCGSG